GEGSSIAKDWLRALEMTAQIDAYPDRILLRFIAALAEQGPDAPALLSANDSLTHQQLVEGATGTRAGPHEQPQEKRHISRRVNLRLNKQTRTPRHATCRRAAVL